ncbi:MAG: carboxypeptidase-like regulatory domain-containing protein, partial [Bacteroidota bacterium]
MKTNLITQSQSLLTYVAVLMIISLQAVGQEKTTISGYVRDASSGEDLIGATVQIEGSSTGVVTNLYGFYSLSIPKGKVTIKVSYVGYDVFTIEKNITVN